jgi:beta-phosphoglucomutase-like phosphatase (HAD superfamily)
LSDRPRAVLVVTGSELVRGERTDLNGPFLAREALKHGLEPARIAVVGDNPVELEAALRDATERVGRLEAELQDLRERDQPSTTPELEAVLRRAEEAVAGIFASTRERAERELHQVERERDLVAREIDSMRAWRDRAAPLIDSVRSALGDMRDRVTDVGVGIRAVLEPVNTAAARLSVGLASLDALDLPGEPRDQAGRTDPDDASNHVIALPEEQPTGTEPHHDPWP